MITFRSGFFETNSSSVHVLVIPKDTKIAIPNEVYLHRGEYGWEDDEVYDTLDYFYQACVDAGKEEVNKLIDYLRYKGVEEIHCVELDNEEILGTRHEYSGYIDNSGDIPLDDLFANESLLDRFLFGDSFVKTGNDNGYNCPDKNDYDPSIYDTIEKGN